MKVKLINEIIKNNYGKNLLRARGIKDVDEFLNPDSSALQTWRDLENIRDGVVEIFNLPPNARIGLVVD